MADWSSSGDSNQGLAKDPNDILVFGYACKLFRDDQKAVWLDDEHHLIPWMGDSSITIDRYDGRGALMDLSGNGAEGVEPIEGILAKEAELEELLDRERYRDLREDSEFDDTQYQEVEFRKFQCDVNDSVCRRESSYAAVGYCYDQPNQSAAASNSIPEISKAEDDRPFIKPDGLMLPPQMSLPPTIKLHSVIEKTAKFIANHGSQMEIILKTKQSGNPLFNFLDYKDTLNPYFKFLVQAIREKSYIPSENSESTTVLQPESNKTEPDDNNSDSDEDEYLHPSLFSNFDSSSRPIPKYKSATGSSTYSLLVSKIRGSSNSDTPSPTPAADYTSTESPNGSYGQFAQPNMYYSQSGYPSDNYSDPNSTYSPSQNQQPSPNDQLVIEKMASYVVKNGIAFEELARTKGDPRFIFLNPSHEYHWYYLNCKERFRVETSAVVASQPFVNYSSEDKNSTKNAFSATKESIFVPKKIIELPLSASGIPIANLESISNRPTSIPPEVASRIELIKKKNSLFAKKESSAPKIQFSTTIGKGMLNETVEGADATADNDISSKTSVSSDTQFQSGSEVQIKEYPSKEMVNNTSSATVPDRKKNNEDAELLRKQMRRQKAAIFLKLKNIATSSNSSEILASATNNNIDSVHKIENNDSELEILEQKNGCKSKLSEAENERLESPEPVPRKPISKKHFRRSRSKSRSRSRSCSRSHSSASSNSDSSDSTRRRKHSKRKSSKKRKKKHGHVRSQSSSRSSKKSKKHKR